MSSLVDKGPFFFKRLPTCMIKDTSRLHINTPLVDRTRGDGLPYRKDRGACRKF